MFYDVFLELCEQKGVKPTQAAREIGLSKSIPTTWKKKQLTPQGESLGKIAAYFGVTVDRLLGVEENEKPTIPEDDGPKAKLIKLCKSAGEKEAALILEYAEKVFALTESSSK